MDYSLSEALATTNVGAIQDVLLVYDVNCQYSVHLAKRFLLNPFINIPSHILLRFAVGSFHVRSHVRHCYYRYALLYMYGAGLIDGEILETLWAVLNNISPCTRGASAAHRDEILDDHMNHSNWKKLKKDSKKAKRKWREIKEG